MKRLIYLLFVLLLALPAYGAMVFSDDFEYEVGTNSGDATAFMTSGGWDYVKSDNCDDSAGCEQGWAGMLTTETSIPGFSGSFPGTNSSRVLLINALPETYNTQTDFYLGLSGGTDYIPANVWFQWWSYVQYYGDELSQFRSDDKFLYPCNGTYGCHTHHWIFTTGSFTWWPGPEGGNHNSVPLGDPSSGEFYWKLQSSAGVDTIVYGDPPVYDGSEDNLGQTNLTTWAEPNTWMLVKININTSTTSGSFEMWTRKYGTPTWTKIAEWIDGTTPNFEWTSTTGGHVTMRMPSTVGKATSRDEDYDYWIYMDDFQMAESESDLTVYTDGAPATTKRINVGSPIDIGGILIIE